MKRMRNDPLDSVQQSERSSRGRRDPNSQYCLLPKVGYKHFSSLVSQEIRLDDPKVFPRISLPPPAAH